MPLCPKRFLYFLSPLEKNIRHLLKTYLPLSRDSLEDDLSTATTSEEYDANMMDEYFSDSGSWEDEDDQGEFHEPVNNSLGVGFATVSAECGNFSIRWVLRIGVDL